MDWKLFISTFCLIFVAELPDKTALATLLMATRQRPWPLFLGVAAAFVFQTAIAVLFGGVFGKLPERWVHLAAGLLFLAFAVMAWRRNEEEEEQKEEDLIEKKSAEHGGFLRAAWSAFVVIFIAEWGDLTQLASASLAAKYHARTTIFVSSVLALWTVTAIAILAGNRMKMLVEAQLLTKIAAFAFAGVGVYFLHSWIQAS